MAKGDIRAARILMFSQIQGSADNDNPGRADDVPGARHNRQCPCPYFTDPVAAVKMWTARLRKLPV
jgi:hypothetical protein